MREHARALEEAGATAKPVRRLAEIESVDGLVIPGGESTTLWRWRPRLTCSTRCAS